MLGKSLFEACEFAGNRVSMELMRKPAVVVKAEIYEGKKDGAKGMVSGEERTGGGACETTTSAQGAVVRPLTALGSPSEWFAQASEHNKQAIM